MTSQSLGRVLNRHIELAREVRDDRDGIRTFFDVDGIHLKFEILLEGRIDLVGAMDPKLDVPALRVDDTATLREGLRILGTLPRE